MIARIDKEKLMNTVDDKLEEMKQNLREKGKRPIFLSVQVCPRDI